MTTSTENGFSLVEVLVSVFVLTVGVIGAAGMQLTALRTTQQSVFQTRALHLAAEMADKMRANVAQMRLEDGVNPYLRVDYQSSSPAMDHQSENHCYSADAQCDAEQLAHFDIDELQQRVGSELPAGRARICRDALPWNSANRNFNWDCANPSASAASLVIKIGWQEKNPDGKPIQGSSSSAPNLVLTVAPYAK